VVLKGSCYQLVWQFFFTTVAAVVRVNFQLVEKADSRGTGNFEFLRQEKCVLLLHSVVVGYRIWKCRRRIFLGIVVCSSRNSLFTIRFRRLGGGGIANKQTWKMCWHLFTRWRWETIPLLSYRCQKIVGSDPSGPNSELLMPVWKREKRGQIGPRNANLI
jgi:hypothetical protein